MRSFHDSEQFSENMSVIRPYVPREIWNYFVNSSEFDQFVNTMVAQLYLHEQIYAGSPNLISKNLKKLALQAKAQHLTMVIAKHALEETF